MTLRVDEVRKSFADEDTELTLPLDLSLGGEAWAAALRAAGVRA
ncbi:MAG TPA: hypothetical protein VGR28_11040 [Candidatus Thermoplasmatota archaeon]|jgi:hypothetical protein|nr:hypothetical protein [Candidatus Thermoplasmatota archaeon]